MIADNVAQNLEPCGTKKSAPMALDDLQSAITTLRQVHDSIMDLRARCLSVAEIEDINHMIQTLETRLERYQSECARLSESLREAEHRSDIYERRSRDADAKLASLQRTISQRLTEPNTRVVSGKA